MHAGLELDDALEQLVHGARRPVHQVGAQQDRQEDGVQDDDQVKVPADQAVVALLMVDCS